jgi:hypothetical protein
LPRLLELIEEAITTQSQKGKSDITIFVKDDFLVPNLPEHTEELFNKAVTDALVQDGCVCDIRCIINPTPTPGKFQITVRGTVEIIPLDGFQLSSTIMNDMVKEVKTLVSGKRKREDDTAESPIKKARIEGQ